MRKSFILVLIIALFLLGEYRMAYATETGKIIGTIKDANKKGLPEVTVTVTSPNLMGERTVVTNKGPFYDTGITNRHISFAIQTQGHENHQTSRC